MFQSYCKTSNTNTIIWKLWKLYDKLAFLGLLCLTNLTFKVEEFEFLKMNLAWKGRFWQCQFFWYWWMSRKLGKGIWENYCCVTHKRGSGITQFINKSFENRKWRKISSEELLILHPLNDTSNSLDCIQFPPKYLSIYWCSKKYRELLVIILMFIIYLS